MIETVHFPVTCNITRITKTPSAHSYRNFAGWRFSMFCAATGVADAGVAASTGGAPSPGSGPDGAGSGAASERGGGKGEGFTLNVPLRGGTSGHDHREAFSDALKVIEHHFSPDLVIISAGFDSRRGDMLGGLMLEDTDFSEMTKDVLRIAEKYSAGRVVGLLEGGYNLNLLGGSVVSHLHALL